MYADYVRRSHEILIKEQANLASGVVKDSQWWYRSGLKSQYAFQIFFFGEAEVPRVVFLLEGLQVNALFTFYRN